MSRRKSASAAVPEHAVAELVGTLIPDAEMNPASAEDVVRLPSFLSKLRAVEAMTGAPYAETDYALQDALVLRRLQQMVNTLRLNPVWRERMEQAGLTGAPASFEEWQKMPISDKVAQRDLFMGERSGMVVPLDFQRFEIVASGGTSAGLPVETVYPIRELHDTYELAGEFMGRYQLPAYLTGDGPKWMITTLADYQMWSSGTMVGGVLQNIPGTNYIGAGPVMMDVYQHMMSYPGPKAIMGISQSIAMLVDLGAGMPEGSRNSFRVAMYGSGLLPQRKQAELKELYPNLEILSYFAATQAETIGLQLDAASPVLTAVPGLHLVEIVDENGRWVEEGEEGELVVTRLHAHEAPFPRYKVGDRMVRRPRRQGDGLKAEQFEFSGRSGDIIHLCDTQYPAPLIYAGLVRELKAGGILDLDAAAHEVQFVNDRKAKTLTLLAVVDEPGKVGEKVAKILGEDGLRRLFVEAVAHSLSIFNKGEANPFAMERTGYQFALRFVGRDSPDIHRTAVGKVPLLRDLV